MSETARALGLPGEIEFEGKRLKVQRVTFKIEGLFESWLEANLAAGLERSLAHSSDRVYRDRLKAANEQVAAGDFAWDEVAARRAARTLRGFRELSYYCVADLQPNWTREDHERLLAAPGAIDRLYRVIHDITAPLKNGSAPGEEEPGAST